MHQNQHGSELGRKHWLSWMKQSAVLQGICKLLCKFYLSSAREILSGESNMVETTPCCICLLDLLQWLVQIGSGSLEGGRDRIMLHNFIQPTHCSLGLDPDLSSPFQTEVASRCPPVHCLWWPAWLASWIGKLCLVYLKAGNLDDGSSLLQAYFEFWQIVTNTIAKGHILTNTIARGGSIVPQSWGDLFEHL